MWTSGTATAASDIRRAQMTGIGADDEEFRAERREAARRRAEHDGQRREVAPRFELPYRVEIERPQQDFGRAVAAQRRAAALVDETIIFKRGFPARAANQPDPFHPPAHCTLPPSL
jgi:hypothetical protein